MTSVRRRNRGLMIHARCQLGCNGGQTPLCGGGGVVPRTRRTDIRMPRGWGRPPRITLGPCGGESGRTPVCPDDETGPFVGLRDSCVSTVGGFGYLRLLTTVERWPPAISEVRKAKQADGRKAGKKWEEREMEKKKRKIKGGKK